ncbi:MAG: hypothetical protein KF729_26190 [Sandaracinaceae bacterium]|nr:hypothetical protein [Sandaracinaceae bacterium]
MRALSLTLALLALAAPARADCEVRGVASLERLRVRVGGARLRTFAVNEVPIAVRPGRGTRYRDVRVLAPVAFEARTDARIPWTVPRSGTLAGGMLWLEPNVEIEDVREGIEDEGLLVRVQVDAGVWIERVRAACDAIAVGLGEGGAQAPAWGATGGPRWQLANTYAWVRSELDDEEAPSVRLEAPRGLPSPLVEVERRGGWVRVVGRFESGALLRGWVRSHHLRAESEAPPPSRPYLREVRAGPAGLCRRGRPDRDEYVGPAHVAVGSAVRFAPGAEVWGTVAEPAVLTVSWRHGEAWARLVHVPGLRGDGRCPEVITQAWVERSQVTLSGERASIAVPGSLLGIE